MKFDDYDDPIGTNIKRLRKEKGITQDELSQATGITIKSLSQIENGHTQARRANILSIAKALGCNAAELSKPFAPERNTNKKHEEIKELKEIVNSLKKESLLALNKKERDLIEAFRQLSLREQTIALKNIKKAAK